MLLKRLQHTRQPPPLPVPPPAPARPPHPTPTDNKERCRSQRQAGSPTNLCSSGAQGASSDHPAPCRQKQPSLAGLILRPGKVQFSRGQL